MRWSISDTAEYGDLTQGPRVIDDHVRENMRKLLDEIQDGTFAREWIAEMDARRAQARRAAEPPHARRSSSRSALELRVADDAAARRGAGRRLTRLARRERQPVRPAVRSGEAPQRGADGRARPRARARDAEGHRLHRRGPRAARSIGVATTWIETMPCNLNQRALAQHVKRGIREAGGTPMEFNTIAVSDGVSMGTEGMRASLVSREVIADSIELVARGHLFDGLVCLVGCDKTIPAARDGARAARPAGARALQRLDRARALPRSRRDDPGRVRGASARTPRAR